MNASPAPEREALAGLVERVTFHNPETGFCVLRVKVRGQRVEMGEVEKVSFSRLVNSLRSMDLPTGGPPT